MFHTEGYYLSTILNGCTDIQLTGGKVRRQQDSDIIFYRSEISAASSRKSERGLISNSFAREFLNSS